MFPAVLRSQRLFDGVQIVQVVEAQCVFGTSVRVSPWWGCTWLLLLSQSCAGAASRLLLGGCWTLLQPDGCYF